MNLSMKSIYAEKIWLKKDATTKATTNVNTSVNTSNNVKVQTNSRVQENGNNYNIPSVQKPATPAKTYGQEYNGIGAEKKPAVIQAKVAPTIKRATTSENLVSPPVQTATIPVGSSDAFHQSKSTPNQFITPSSTSVQAKAPVIDGKKAATVKPPVIQKYSTNSYEAGAKEEVNGTGASGRNPVISKLGELSTPNFSHHFRTYLRSDGTLWASGSGENFRNGDAEGKKRFVPEQILVEEQRNVKFVNLFCSHHRAYAITTSGEVYSWGSGLYGALGHGDDDDRSFAERIEYFLTNRIRIKKVVPSQYSTLFLSSEDKLYACGYNSCGQLGGDSLTNRASPILVGQVKTITSCFTVANSSFAIDESGQLWAWGANEAGQLGLGNTNMTLSPEMTNVKNAFKVIAYCTYPEIDGEAKGSISLVLKKDGSLAAAGTNIYGELGTRKDGSFCHFGRIDVVERFKDIFVNRDSKGVFCGALSTRNEAWFWGSNASGQFGFGDKKSCLLPTKLKGDFQGKIKRVKLGIGCIYILTTEDKMYAAGFGSNGNLGTGKDAAINSSFSLVGEIDKPVKDFSVYGSSGITILFEDGTIKAAGYNKFGEVGVGSTKGLNVLTPRNVQI